MQKLSTEEKVLDYIIKSLNSKNTNQYYIYDTIIETTGLNEQEIMQSLYFLQSDKLIHIIKSSPNNDFSSPCLIELTSLGFHYFERKTKEHSLKIKEWIWWSVTTLLSFIALIISIFK